MLVQPALLHHLKRLVDLDDIATIARAFVDEVLAVAGMKELHYLSVIPLNGIELEGNEHALDEGSVRMRQLSDAEQGQWWQGDGVWQADRMVVPPEVLLELRYAGPRCDWYHPPRDRAALFVCALHLHGYEVAGSVVAESPEPIWVHGVRHSGPINIPRYPRAVRTLTAEGFREVVATARLMEKDYNLNQPASTKDLSLHRFALGIARDDAADAVLDFTIALESLLLPYDEDARKGELAYRFRIHGAHYIADTPGERRSVFKALRDIYEMRSRLVHGGNYPTPAQVQSARVLAHDLSRRGLIRAVQEGFPTVGWFNGKMLDV
jgi:hypothetical protein